MITVNLSDVIAIIALVISIISIYKSHKANSIANELRKANNDLQITANKLQMAQVEMDIRNMINNAKAKFFELAKNASAKDKYVKPHTNFNATVKVYEEWNNLE